jgi:hypothetical protein
LNNKNVALSELNQALREENSIHEASELLLSQQETNIIQNEPSAAFSTSSSLTSILSSPSSVNHYPLMLSSSTDGGRLYSPLTHFLSPSIETMQNTTEHHHTLSYKRVQELQQPHVFAEGGEEVVGGFRAQKSRRDSGSHDVTFDNKFVFSTSSHQNNPSLPSGSLDSPLMFRSPQQGKKDARTGFAQYDDDFIDDFIVGGDFEL